MNCSNRFPVRERPTRCDVLRILQARFNEEERMIQALIDWWRGYSEEDMENVKDRLSYSKSGGLKARAGGRTPRG